MNLRRRRAVAVAVAVLAAVTLDRAADAEPAPPPRKSAYSRYEQESLDAALGRLNTAVDPSPEGKVIDGVEIVTLDVFEPRDFIPKIFLGFVNWFHVTTHKYVVDREVLLPRGARYDKDLVAETARNLRALTPISLVLVVP